MEDLLSSLFENKITWSFGKPKVVRVTDETPRRVSAIDIIKVITNAQWSDALKTLNRMKCADPGFFQVCGDYKFGRDKEPTSAIGMEDLLQFIQITAEHRSGTVRVDCASTVTAMDKHLAIARYFHALTGHD